MTARSNLETHGLVGSRSICGPGFLARPTGGRLRRDRTKFFMSIPTEYAPPGYAEIKAASALHPDSGAWAFFMREIVRLPRQMTPTVFQVMRLGLWKSSPDPIEEVRSNAIDLHCKAWAKSA